MATLKQGAKGSGVKSLQGKLNKAPGMSPRLKLDGIFGPKTEAAVKAFQKKFKLKVDGMAGSATLQTLEAPGKPVELDLGFTDSYKDNIRISNDCSRGVQKNVKTFLAAAAGLEKAMRKQADEIRRMNAPYLKLEKEYLALSEKIVKLEGEFAKSKKGGAPRDRLLALKTQIERLHSRASAVEERQEAHYFDMSDAWNAARDEVKSVQKVLAPNF